MSVEHSLRPSSLVDTETATHLWTPGGLEGAQQTASAATGPGEPPELLPQKHQQPVH